MKYFDRQINNNNICIFTDFDGTLVPFKKNPYKVILPKSEQKIIMRLSSKIKGFIFVTGRTAADLRNRLGQLSEFDIIASHGLESPLLTIAEKRVFQKRAKELYLLYKKEKKNIDENILIQNKEYSVCINFRNCQELNKNIIKKNIGNIFFQKFNHNNFEILAGAEILEFKPRGIDKSTAVEYYISKHQADKYYYFGDDLTDNTVFKRLKNKITTVYVNSYDLHQTEKIDAEYYLNNYKEYRLFLKKLVGWLK